jgi:hypothetical protein
VVVLGAVIGVFAYFRRPATGTGQRGGFRRVPRNDPDESSVETARFPPSAARIQVEPVGRSIGKLQVQELDVTADNFPDFDDI